MLVASDEATAGSVMAKQERISPANSGVSHSSWGVSVYVCVLSYYNNLE